MSVEKPYILSIAGPNGVGKSTNARLVQEIGHFDFDQQLRPLITEIDQEILDDYTALDLYYKESLNDIEKKLSDWVSDKIVKRESFSLASNFIPGYSSNDKFVARALEAGYEHRLLYLGVTDVNTCIMRVEFREEKHEHPVTESEIRRRYTEGLRQLNELFLMMREGTPLKCPVHVIEVHDCTGSIENVSRIFIREEGRPLNVVTDNQDLLRDWELLIPEAFKLLKS